MRTLSSRADVLASGCASAPRQRLPATVVYLVRHAEAQNDGTRDPTLSPDGQARAERLAERLAPLSVDAVYATPYRRTQQTAAPLAEASGVDVIVVPIGDWNMDGNVERYIADVAARVRALPAGSVAVVVGHSNTTPHVAGALAGTDMEDLPSDMYDRLFVVTLDGAEPGALETTTY